MVILYLTVDRTGLISKWDSKPAALQQTEEYSVEIRLTEEQEQRLLNAVRALNPVILR